MSMVPNFKQITTPRDVPYYFDEESGCRRPFSVVVVSSDSKTRALMTELIHGCLLNAELASGVSELKSICAGSLPIACLCGSELADGSLPDVVKCLEAQPAPVPLIVISPALADKMPACILDSLKAGALATICYPYRLNDLQILLWSAIQVQTALQ